MIDTLVRNHFRLADCTPLGITRLRRTLLRAVAQGEFELTLDLTRFSGLDMRALRALISLLRSVRECGGNITLAVAHAGVRRTLAVTALDKIFTVVQAQEACT